MSRYTSTLSPTKITPEHLAALKQLAAKQQTNTSQIVRLAIARACHQLGKLGKEKPKRNGEKAR